MTSFMSDPLLRFSNRQGFHLFAEGAQALSRFQKGRDPKQLQSAIQSLEQCTQADPGTQLGRFYLALAHSMNGPAGEQRARDEFERMAADTPSVSLRLTAQCNYACLLLPNPRAETMLNDVLR